MDDQHFYFWCCNDIYDINLMFVSLAKTKIFSARIQNPNHGNLVIKAFTQVSLLKSLCTSAPNNTFVQHFFP